MASHSASAFSFGDAQVVRPVVADDKMPDLIMVDLSTAQAKLVVELKTFWTVELEECPVNSAPNSLIPMQPHFGNLPSML